MTVFMVETYLVKPDKLGEFAAFLKKTDAFMKKRPDLYKEIKSHKHFSHFIGGNLGGFVTMMEIESLSDAEKVYKKFMEDKEFRTDIQAEWAALLVPGTYSLSIWNPVP